MPLDVLRLLDSDLFALSTGEEFKAAVALWCKSWTQVPAGSIPDDDRVLAHLSGAGVRWKKVRGMALRNFVLCSDGRLYHTHIAEKVKEAWAMRLRQRERSSRGNAKRWGEQIPTGDDQNLPTRDEIYCPIGDAVGDALWDRKGQGQCKGEGNNSGSTNSKELPVQEDRANEKSKKRSRNQYPSDFVLMCDGYPMDSNMSKSEAFGVWKRLPAEEREAAIKSLPAYRAYCLKNVSWYRPVHLCRYLSKNRAEGFLATADKIAAAAGVFIRRGTPQWDAWCEFYQKTRRTSPPFNKDDGWYFPTEWPNSETRLRVV